jgi:serine/threonine protein kinase
MMQQLSSCKKERKPMQATCVDYASLLGDDLSSLCGGRFREAERIGAGNYGSVYGAVDTHNRDRRVALKLFNLKGLPSRDRALAWYTWRREADMLRTLHHSDIPHLLAKGSDGGYYYLVMDLVEGKTLEDVLFHSLHHRLPLWEVVPVGLWLCDMLEFLHAQAIPVIHCDLKPANIMCTTEGRYVLTDFGVARWYGEAVDQSYGITDELDGFDLATLGSTGYGAPEQYADIAQPSPRSDLFALGATLHQLLSGHHPRWNRPTIFDFPLLTGLGDPPGSDQVIAMVYALLEKDPRRRPELTEIRQVFLAQNLFPHLTPA